jgi:hypothetical protein
VSARPARTVSQEGEDAEAAVTDVHVPMTLTRAGLYRLTVEIRNTDGQVRDARMLYMQWLCGRRLEGAAAAACAAQQLHAC